MFIKLYELIETFELFLGIINDFIVAIVLRRRSC